MALQQFPLATLPGDDALQLNHLSSIYMQDKILSGQQPGDIDFVAGQLHEHYHQWLSIAPTH